MKRRASFRISLGAESVRVNGAMLSSSSLPSLPSSAGSCLSSTSAVLVAFASSPTPDSRPMNTVASATTLATTTNRARSRSLIRLSLAFIPNSVSTRLARVWTTATLDGPPRLESGHVSDRCVIGLNGTSSSSEVGLYAGNVATETAVSWTSHPPVPIVGRRLAGWRGTLPTRTHATQRLLIMR